MSSISLSLSVSRAVGFPGSSSESVHYALNYLCHLTRIERRDRVNGMDESSASIVYPKLTLPDVFELFHHTNQVTPIYILEAITGTSALPILPLLISYCAIFSL